MKRSYMWTERVSKHRGPSREWGEGKKVENKPLPEMLVA